MCGCCSSGFGSSELVPCAQRDSALRSYRLLCLTQRLLRLASAGVVQAAAARQPSARTAWAVTVVMVAMAVTATARTRRPARAVRATQRTGQATVARRGALVAAVAGGAAQP